MRESSTNEVKKSEIGKMFLRRRFDVCALSETKLKGKCEMVGSVLQQALILTTLMSGVARDRAMEGVALLLSGWLMKFVV